MRTWHPFLAVPAFFLLAGCGSEQRAGTATDTENTISGIVRDAEGKPIGGATVLLVTDELGIHSSWSTTLARATATTLGMDDTVLSTLTEPDGTYRFDTIPNRSFSLAFRSDSLVGLLKNLDGADVDGIVLSLRLQKQAWLKGKLQSRNSSDPLYGFGDHFRVSIAGTGRALEVVSGKEFVLDGVPAGPQELVYYPADEYLLDMLVNAGVPLDSLVRKIAIQVSSGDTLQLGSMEWTYPADFYWDTDTVAIRRMLSGRVYGSADCPAGQTRIWIVLDSSGFSYRTGLLDPYLPDSLEVKSDSDGTFRIPAPASRFHVEYMRFSSKDTSSVCGVGHQGPFDPQEDLPGDRLPDIRLKAPARLRGQLVYVQDQEALVATGDHFRLGIRGTTRWVDAVPGEFFEIPALSEGQQSLLFYPGNSFIWTVADTACPSREALVIDSVQVTTTAGKVLETQVVTYRLPECFLK